mgnify:CR=1 FL=1
MLIRKEYIKYASNETFSVISDDLTTGGKKGNVPYGTLTAISESPFKFGMIYTGSDDGYVHITKDNGESWQNITHKNLGESLVNAIEVSPHDKSTVYIATTKYKFNDHTPALYKSTDYGSSWVSINSGIPMGAFTRVVREDPMRKDLLYAGTEKGLYLSWNGGKTWKPFQLNLPIVPITDATIKDNNLIVATQGRSVWIIDDLTLIHQLYDSNLNDNILFKPKDTYRMRGGSRKGSKTTGTNHPNGVITYFNLHI